MRFTFKLYASDELVVILYEMMGLHFFFCDCPSLHFCHGVHFNFYELTYFLRDTTFF